MPHCTQVAFTTDGWTSATGDPYMTLTLHYINKDFEMRKFVLNFDNFVGRHTAYHIGKLLDEMIREHPALVNVPHKVIVHDAAANMISAIEKMEVCCESQLCGDHLLNTALKHATDDCKEVHSTIAAATNLATRVKRSTLANNLLEEECKALGLDFIKVITPVATRWNSNSMMLDSILRMKAPLVSLREKTGSHLLEDVIPTDDQFILMESLSPILATLSRLSEFMSTDSQPTMHKLLILLHNVRQFLSMYVRRQFEKKIPKTDVIKEFSTLLQKELFKSNRFGDCGKLIFANFINFQ